MIIWYVVNQNNFPFALTVKQMTHKGKSSNHNQEVLSFDDIREATNSFSEVNKLGEGGYGPVYKVITSNLFYHYQVPLVELALCSL